MKKKCKVVMLPTEKSSIQNEYKLTHTPGEHLNVCAKHLYLTSDDEIKEGDWYINVLLGGGKLYNKRDNPNKSLPEHKKVIASTDSELKWTDDNEILVIDHFHGRLPTFSEDFIKAYVEAGGIDKVMVEYEEYKIKAFAGGEGIRLKLTDNNEVVISIVEKQEGFDNTTIDDHSDLIEEKMYSEQDLVYAVAHIAARLGHGSTSEEMKQWNEATREWIDEN